jgi:hypothetical protein
MTDVTQEFESVLLATEGMPPEQRVAWVYAFVQNQAIAGNTANLSRCPSYTGFKNTYERYVHQTVIKNPYGIKPNASRLEFTWD